MEIVWTISYGNYCMLLKTRSKVDKEDKEVSVPSVALIQAMKRLSNKYCNKGFAVLFDVDC